MNSALACFWFAAAGVAFAVELDLPTANRALLDAGGGARFFQGTAANTWQSGQYGCVRSGGAQFHEGMDVRCLQRDRRGEPTDAVVAVADGEVAYVANIAGQSNYGRYVVVRHRWDGVEVFSLYSHLRAIATGLRVGQSVTQGLPLGTLGYSGTQNIPRERAHLHFEVGFQLNRNFVAWFAPHMARGDRNDHGNFNGLNLLGMDPAPLLRARRLNFREHIEAQPIAFTVLFPARRPPLSWMRAQQWCIVNGPEPAPVTGYEVWFTAVGVPTFVRPRTDRQTVAWMLLGVNEQAVAACACRRLVERDARRTGWRLNQRGLELMELLGF